MKAPKCRVCGHEHWQSDPHKFDNPVRQTSNKPKALDTNSNKRILELEKLVATLQAEVRSLTEPFDKTAYQREYMRKRRAATT